ncbi:hypothetical protein B0H14DRAFT_3476913 [Mycena olivaceomarginata]|nr:hypothetical protein B0H14DRAFT_3476913 [Mycena olivaceomarginata]
MLAVRVDKRRKRQEEEEELGLDEDMKEVLGLNDTDSDESDSDNDSESGSEAADSADEVEGEEGDEDDEDSSDDSDAEEPPISVEEALRDPVYVLLKNAEILRLHRASKARLVLPSTVLTFFLILLYTGPRPPLAPIPRLCKSSNASPSSNAWDVLKQRAEEQPKLSLTEGVGRPRNGIRTRGAKSQNAARREKKREANVKRKGQESCGFGFGSGLLSTGSSQKHRFPRLSTTHEKAQTSPLRLRLPLTTTTTTQQK